MFYKGGYFTKSYLSIIYIGKLFFKKIILNLQILKCFLAEFWGINFKYELL